MLKKIISIGKWGGLRVLLEGLMIPLISFSSFLFVFGYLFSMDFGELKLESILFVFTTTLISSYMIFILAIPFGVLSAVLKLFLKNYKWIYVLDSCFFVFLSFLFAQMFLSGLTYGISIVWGFITAFFASKTLWYFDYKFLLGRQ